MHKSTLDVRLTTTTLCTYTRSVHWICSNAMKKELANVPSKNIPLTQLTLLSCAVRRVTNEMLKLKYLTHKTDPLPFLDGML